MVGDLIRHIPPPIWVRAGFTAMFHEILSLICPRTIQYRLSFEQIGQQNGHLLALLNIHDVYRARKLKCYFKLEI